VIYEHSQTARAPFYAFAVVAVVFIVALGFGESPLGGTIGFVVFLAVIALVMLNFSRLTTTIDQEAVRAHFDQGWPKREIPLNEISTVDVVRNKWWYGFGARLTPHGWLYNVWGLDAVEITLVSGKAFRIGTDRPDDLAATLRKVASSAR